MNHDIFISFKSEYAKEALDICHVLEENHFPCWIATRDIPAGRSYADIIVKAIQHCKIFLIIYNESAAQSSWIAAEANIATDENKFIIPYRIDNSPLQGSLRLMLIQRQWIDASAGLRKKYEELISTVSAILHPTEQIESIIDAQSEKQYKKTQKVISKGVKKSRQKKTTSEHFRYDIFISYRREGGYETAHSISLYLKGKGYRVFFDLENLRGGNFNTQLLDIIEHCQDFILVLPENGLDRCHNEDDWVRQELAHAIKHEKRLIPVLLKGFEFPDNLPADIQEISKFQGVAASDINYKDAAYIKIEEYLISKRGISWRRHKGYILGVITAILLGGGIYGGTQWRAHKQFSALSADLANEMALPIVGINGMLGDVIALEQAWSHYTDDVKAAANNTAKLAQMERDYKLLIQLAQHFSQKYSYTLIAIQLSEEEKNILRLQGVSLTDIEQYHSLAVGAFYQEMQDLLKQLLNFSSAESIHLGELLIADNIELNLLSCRLSAEASYLYYLYVMSFLDPVATAPMKQELLTKLFNFGPIESDKPSQYYKDRHERILIQLEAAILKSEQRVSIEEVVSQRAEQYIEKVGQAAETKAALSRKKGELALAYTRSFIKFTLLPEDDQYMQWAKILKVVELTQNSSDKSTLYAHLDHWLLEHMRLCPESKAYAQAAQVYYGQLAAGQVEPCGIVVVGTKDDEPHPLYKIGDIVTQRKGQTVKNVDEYAALAKKEGLDSIKLLRLDASGKLQTIQTTLPPTEVLTAFLPLIPETP